MKIARLTRVIIAATFGTIVGALIGFFLAVFINPEASPSYVFWSAFISALVFLLILNCYGTLFYGAIFAAVGWFGGSLVGFGVSLIWHPVSVNLIHWGAYLGAIVMAIWQPRFVKYAKKGMKSNFSGRSLALGNKLKTSGYNILTTKDELLPSPPPYKSDGIILKIDELQNELKSLCPDIDFGTGKDNIPTEVTFYAADFDFVQSTFYNYLANRMVAEGITKWEEAKFDCDDFALYLNSCATMCIKKSNLNGATHTFFQTIVLINNGNLLGVTDGCHANNIVRCTDGEWYFVEPQSALAGEFNQQNVVLRSFRSLMSKATTSHTHHTALGSMFSEIENTGFMCTLADQIEEGVTLVTAKF